jgi:hypothetical protein
VLRAEGERGGGTWVNSTLFFPPLQGEHSADARKEAQAPSRRGLNRSVHLGVNSARAVCMSLLAQSRASPPVTQDHYYLWRHHHLPAGRVLVPKVGGVVREVCPARPPPRARHHFPRRLPRAGERPVRPGDAEDAAVDGRLGRLPCWQRGCVVCAHPRGRNPLCRSSAGPRSP